MGRGLMLPLPISAVGDGDPAGGKAPVPLAATAGDDEAPVAVVLTLVVERV